MADIRADSDTGVGLLSADASRDDVEMITFEQFVKSLGDHAQQYTPEQLQQLHLDVQRFAQVIIAIYRAREQTQSDRFPQHRLDDANPDRTLNEENKTL